MDMASKRKSNKPVGVLGAGSFGTAVANILAENSNVFLFARNEETVNQMIKGKNNNGQSLSANIIPTNNLAEVAESCEIIFPVVPSSGFRNVIQKIAPYLHPYHILIHGTKGLDVNISDAEFQNKMKFDPSKIMTMSEVIRQETVVVRIGCLAGPNLAKELADHQPAATVIASHFDEVISAGKRLLRTDRFRVYGNKDMTGIELAGVLKNIIAIASGALSGLGMGENARALLISRGMVEMIFLGKALGGNVQAFIGLAGIGDLVATCSSKFSRNFTVGYRLAGGETLSQILDSMEEVAEGVNTVRIMKHLAEFHQVRAPITSTLYEVLFNDMKVEKALDLLMKFPLEEDISFL